VKDREITRALIILTKSGLAESSVCHFRDSLLSFFAWAVRERMIAPAMAISRPIRSRQRQASRRWRVPQLANPKDAQSAECRSTSALTR
jgi:hypothetical protein